MTSLVGDQWKGQEDDVLVGQRNVELKEEAKFTVKVFNTQKPADNLAAAHSNYAQQ